MLRWKDSDVEFFVPQLAAVLMSKGVPSRNVYVSWHLCVIVLSVEGYGWFCWNGGESALYARCLEAFGFFAQSRGKMSDSPRVGEARHEGLADR